MLAADDDGGATEAGDTRLLDMLCRACHSGDVDTVCDLLEIASQLGRPPALLDTPLQLDDALDDEFDEAERCPIHFAAVGGWATIVQLLVEAGASTAVSSHSLFASVPTPLMLAASRGHTSVVRVLLAASADTEQAEPPLGRTPLHAAVCSGHARTVSALLHGGADWAVRDRDGFSPYSIATARMQSVDPGCDPWELERTLVALGHRAPVSHEARMSGVDAGGNWAAGSEGAKELRSLAARSHERMAKTVRAVEAPVRALALSMQRLRWGLALRSKAISACFSLSPDLVEMIGSAVRPQPPGSMLLARIAALDLPHSGKPTSSTDAPRRV
jgi:hypothetical protein